MRNLTFTDNGKVYRQITKKTARKLHNEGHSVVICASNMRPFGMWGMGCESNTSEDFDKIVNAYEFYNCNSECGKYACFYVSEV